jgi:hypothetical protein
MQRRENKLASLLFHEVALRSANARSSSSTFGESWKEDDVKYISYPSRVVDGHLTMAVILME